MRRALLPALLPIVSLLAAPTLAAAAGAKATLDTLPKRVQDQLWELAGECNRAGGRPGDPTQAVEAADLDGDGTPDLILDEARFPCRGVKPGAVCSEVGCSTYLILSHGGRWRPALDFVGSYCLDRSVSPARFLTVQQNFATSGLYTLNVRYRFRNGLAFQEGRGTC
ncbi:MAG TPA: hypothetical protein VHN20_08920 [Beijerinckiaceae bacterium]|nr:hypothetical protein [Beijerinckiaceae bacterium]